ncbi:uncharacterized protein BDV17DRAFT_113110 [Aspergillus undulatus]|uniref:uncharacterized protein n=1 Tax=Aspergillus undulatus TaxID=1810928 RepID=UPI003CCCDE94
MLQGVVVDSGLIARRGVFDYPDYSYAHAECDTIMTLCPSNDANTEWGRGTQQSKSLDQQWGPRDNPNKTGQRIRDCPICIGLGNMLQLVHQAKYEVRSRGRGRESRLRAETHIPILSAHGCEGRTDLCSHGRLVIIPHGERRPFMILRRFNQGWCVATSLTEMGLRNIESKDHGQIS